MKFYSTLLTLGAVSALAACGGIPDCDDNLDECNRGGAFTEERTAQADKKAVIVAPAPVVAPAPAPVVVAPPPAPMPAPVIDDTPVMTTAEPQFQQISK